MFHGGILTNSPVATARGTARWRGRRAEGESSLSRREQRTPHRPVLQLAERRLSPNAHPIYSIITRQTLPREGLSKKSNVGSRLLLFETPISTRKAPFISTILLGLVEPANLKNISLDRLMEEETVAVDLSSKASPRHATIPITFQNPDDGIEAFNVPPSHAGLQASRTQLRNLKDSTGDTKSKDVSRLVVSMQLTMWMWKGLPPCPRSFTQRGAPERRN
jgi:hypothetical protein